MLNYEIMIYAQTMANQKNICSMCVWGNIIVILTVFCVKMRKIHNTQHNKKKNGFKKWGEYK